MSPSARRTHILVSAAILAIFVGTCAAIDFASGSARVAQWFDDWGEARARKINRAYVHEGVFGEQLHGLLLIDAPQMNYEQGGVYFFGSSNLVFAAQFNDLPAEQSKYLHCYGFPSANPTECLQFIRYFEQADGFLRRGASRTCVVIALSENDLLGLPAEGWYIPSALPDMQVFDYDPGQGVLTVPMPQWKRAYLIRKLRWNDLMSQIPRMHNGLPPPRLDRPGFDAEIKRLLTANLPGATEQQVKDVQAILDYVQSRGAHAAVVRLPAGTWSLGTPFDDAFRKNIPQMCAARGVPFLDLSRLLSDEEFMDAHHPTFLGAEKVRDEMVKFALTQLHAMGVQAEEH